MSISGDSQKQIEMLENFGINNEKYLQGVAELKEVVKNLKLFGVPEQNFEIRLSLVRGHDYYTGTVYETFLNGKESIGSVCGGGRYDNLAEYYTKEKLPGVGISIGLTRLFFQLKENGWLKKEQSAISKAIILPMGADTVADCIELSNKLRKNGISVTLYLEDKKFKNKLAYAVKSNIKYAIFVGEDEVKSQKYTVKNLQETTQTQENLENLIKILKEN